MTSSEANKIKKELLAASEVAKCKMCRSIIDEISRWSSKSYTFDQKTHFLDLCEAKDFESAISYFVNTMLKSLKKTNERDYYSELILRQSDLVMTHQIKPNGKDVIDEALSSSNYPGILFVLRRYMKKASFYAVIDNLLYLLCEIARRPVGEVPEGAKHCVFHLLAQYLSSREHGKMAKMYSLDTFIYLRDKYHCFDETNPLEMSLLQGTVRKNDFKCAWDSYFHPDGKAPQTRITLQVIEHLMNEMDLPHAELAHYLFMCNYIDYNHYHFRDGWMIDAYVSTYNAFYHEDARYLSSVNGYVLEILKEWQQDANHKYQNAKRDLYYWMNDPIPAFKPSLGDEIRSAWQKVADSDDEKAVAEALLPYPLKISKMVETGQYEDAAANVYCILEHLAMSLKAHEDWFDCMWSGGEQTQIVNLVDVLQEVYCHLRQKSDLSNSLKNEMDIHLEIFNKKTWFFGVECGDSRYDDMLSDGKDQYCDYSNLSKSGMWNEWYLPKLRGGSDEYLN